MAGLLRRGPAFLRIACALQMQASSAGAGAAYRPLNGLFDPPSLSRLQPGSTHFSTHNYLYDEIYCRHRPILVLQGKEPELALDAFVAPNATLIGDVFIDHYASVWQSCVLRGDLSRIVLGFYSSLGERTVVHAAAASPAGLSATTVIGAHVTVGANCSLRSCVIMDEAVIGERCVIAEGAVVEKNSMLAPHSVVPPLQRIPSRELWGGNPARFIRVLDAEEIAEIPKLAVQVQRSSAEFVGELHLPFGSAYVEAEKVKAALVRKA